MTDISPTVVIIDDDPTGAQTLRDVPLLFGVDSELLRDQLVIGTPALCVLTNSRASSADAAAATNARIAEVLCSSGAANALVVSRGDSTLRGHLAAEMQSLEAGLFPDKNPIRVFVPAFVEAGRITREGVHFVRTRDGDVPVGHTSFAQDARLGFRSSDLGEHLVEVGAAAAETDIARVPATLLDAGPERLIRILRQSHGKWVVPDVTSDHHIDTIATAILAAQLAGEPVLVRCAPSLVRALARQESMPPLSDEELVELFPDRSGNGLIVVGSHVPQTTSQLAIAGRLAGVEVLELDLDMLAEGSSQQLRVAAQRAADLLAVHDVILATPRRERRDRSDGGDLARRIAEGLCDVVAEVVERRTPGWVIAKGGITSHETAATALGIRSATVVGQLFASRVSVVDPIDAAPAVVGMPYVIFPGNVGADEDLAVAIERMRHLTAQSRVPLPKENL